MIFIIETNILGICTQEQADAFCEKHTLIKKSDLAKIKELAEKHGIFDELKALNVKIHNIENAKE